MTVKVCNICKIAKKVPDDFYKGNSYNKNKTIYEPLCKLCKCARDKTYDLNVDKKKQYFRHVRNLYGLTQEEYNKMFFEQDNKCKICKNPEKVITKKGIIKLLSVDHCHTTGKVRGLLCQNCNVLLANAKDNIDILESSIIYLKESK